MLSAAPMWWYVHGNTTRLGTVYNKPAFQATDEHEGEEKEGGTDQTKTVQDAALI